MRTYLEESNIGPILGLGYVFWQGHMQLGRHSSAKIPIQVKFKLIHKTDKKMIKPVTQTKTLTAALNLK